METENINLRIPGWADCSVESVEHLLADQPGPLRERLLKVQSRFGEMSGTGSLSGALSAVAATPIFAMLEALRSDYGIPEGEPRLLDLGEATLLGYLYVRAQDDLVDEPERFDRAYVYVVQVLYDACQRAFARALDGSPEYFAFQAKVMADFASAALWEVDVFREDPEAEADLGQIGRKFLPMALPIGALTLLAGKPEDLDRLVHFVIRLGTGLQLLNDVLNIREDHAGGRVTPVLRWLYSGARVSPADAPQQVRLQLLTDQALERALDEADRSLAEAAAIARSLGAHQLAAVAENRASYVKSIPYRLLSLQLGVPRL
jgi:hypothetical protein